MRICYDQRNFVLIVPLNQEHRLQNTCFRPDTACSGNFRQWRSCYDVLCGDQILHKLFHDEVKDAIAEMISKRETEQQWGFTLTHPSVVGWASTMPLANLPPGIKTEEFQPNPHTTATVVKSDEPILAPTTKEVTIVCTIKRNGDARFPVDWCVIVYSMYPGYEVQLGWKGEPRTIPPEEAVFFHIDHPGEPID